MNVTPWKKILKFNGNDQDYYGNDTGKYLDTIHTLPKGSRIIHCDIQCDPERYGFHDQIAIWYEVPNIHEKETEDFSFHVIATGETNQLEGSTHLKTIVLNKGERVWHVYHIPPQR